MSRCLRLTRLTSLGTVAATVLALSGAAEARDLTVVSWGGTFQDAQREIFFAPFGGSVGKKVIDDSWDGGIGILRTKTAGGDGGWDVVEVESEELELGCQEGVFKKLDFDRIGGKDAYLPQAVHECGVGAVLYNFVLGYDKAAVKGTPAGWADFFDLAKFPGKRALRQGPKGNLEIALMADGVPTADVYKVLATPEGVDRAFRKLDTIKPQLLFWKSGAQPGQMMSSGDVVMTTSYNGRMTNAINKDKKPFGIVWNQSLQTVDSWVILATSPNTDAAYGLLAFLGKPELQAKLPAYQPIGVTVVAAVPLVDPALAKDLPSTPANATNVLKLDDAFWIDNVDALSERWTAWSAQK